MKDLLNYPFLESVQNCLQVVGVRLVEPVLAGLGGIAVSFTCESGRCQSHLDQVMAADSFQETLFFSMLLRCFLTVAFGAHLAYLLFSLASSLVFAFPAG